MHKRRWGFAVATGLAAVALTGCGGGAGASQLVKDTFSGSRKLQSGAVEFTLTLTPAGSSTLTSPITLSVGGPFSGLGPGQAGNSELTLRLGTAEVSLLSLGLESLDGNGYVSLGTTSYRLPAGEYRGLESRLSGGGSGTAGILGRLGIDPLRWLIDPRVAGSATVAGVRTTHIRARLNLGALLTDLGTVLAKASSIGVPGAGKISISPAARSKIVAEVRSPSVDIWTGSADQTLRRLALSLTLPVTGTLSSDLGGLKFAALSLNIVYRDLGHPQHFSAPTDLKPYREFEAQVHTLLGALDGAVSGAAPAASTAPGSGSSAGDANAYSQCITAARGDYAKMYKCAGLLGAP